MERTVNPPIGLDDLLTLKECAAWMRMAPRELAGKSKGRNPTIPGFWINQRVVRFHPRTIIAKLAHDAGVAPAVVASPLMCLTAHDKATGEPALQTGTLGT